MSIVSTIVNQFDFGDEPEYEDLPDVSTSCKDLITKTIHKVHNIGNNMKSYKVTYYLNNNLYKVLFYREGGKLHRDTGPAFTLYGKNNLILAEIFFKDGLRHRLVNQGPAEMIMKLSRKGNYIPIEKYFLEGEEIIEEN